MIVEFVEACGFPPPDGLTPIDWRVNIKIPHEQQLNVIKAWSNMGGIHHVKNTMDASWFKAMFDAGSLPDGTIPSGSGIKCMAVDGHECGSLDKKTIDDLLTNLGIKHTKEPLYPHHPTLNPNQRKRADWKVGNTLVEYFGLTGTRSYDLRTQEKLEIVEENGIDFIGLYPEDLVNLDDSLVSKLA